MKKEQFYELLGDIDENAVEAAGKPPVKKLPFKRIIVSAAAVVCVGFFVAVGVLMINNNKPVVNPEKTTAATESTTTATQAAAVKPTDAPATEKPTENQESSDIQSSTVTDISDNSNSSESSEISENSESDNGEEKGDGVVAYDDVSIYYANDGKLYYDTVNLPLDPQEIFKVWKQKNDIGSEVILKGVRIDDNSYDVIEGRVGYHYVGDTFILNITVSENLTDYYSRTSEELLTESLKKTLSEYGNTEYEEINLILE